MTEVPDKVDLNWIARHIVEMREELRALRGVPEKLGRLRTDVDIMAAILRRVDDNQNAFREESRTLFELCR